MLTISEEQASSGPATPSSRAQSRRWKCFEVMVTNSVLFPPINRYSDLL
jgi:hypothetical protein